MKAPAKKLESASAFTLLELLVAMAVMALVMVAIVSITNGTASLTQGAQGRIVGNAELRTALNRLSADLDVALIRSDLPAFAINASSENAVLEFCIASQGYSGDRPFSQVRYEISADSSGLIRAIKGFGWTQDKVPFGSTNSTLSEYPDEDLLGARIFRFDCKFLLSNGTYTSDSEELDNARALVVSLATIDPQALAKMNRPNLPISELASLFPESSNGPAFEAWSALLQSPSFVSDNPSIPPAVLSGIQTAGRIIPLPRQR